MQTLSPSEITELTTKAFVLEAITDKPGCTTRYKDLPGKPLQDFILAGINSAKFFGHLAKDLEDNPNAAIYTHNVTALRASNKHKSDKYINIGLLEMMFLTVAARLKTDDIDSVIDTAVALANNTKEDDATHIINTRKLAWSTSTKDHRYNNDLEEYEDCTSVMDYFERRCRNHPEDTSYYQWSNQYVAGFPILRKFFDEYNKNGEIINTTKDVFLSISAEDPKMRVGIIADMCAAAIFLWLSFNDKPV